MKPVLFDLSQQRGQWYARTTSTRTEQRLGASRIAVVRDWGNGMMDWTSRPPTYFERAEDGWWTHPAAETWRSLLIDRAAIWVRKISDDGSENGSVGRSVGVWRITRLVSTPSVLSFELQERLGDVK